MEINALKASELIYKIERGEPVNIAFFYPDQSVMKALNSFFAKILAKMDMVYLLDTLVTIQREVIINATKANAKRLYFQEEKLDINDPSQYERGMTNFRQSIVGDLEKAREKLARSSFKVRIRIQKVPKGMLFSVTNNAPILPEEVRRIKLRMEKARGYNDFSEAYEDVYDSTEGAGLGIVLVTLLLKNSGIGVDSYTIAGEGASTRCDMVIPSEIRPLEITTNIKKEILNQVKGLPTFPKHIIELQRLCGDPDATIGEISKRIMMDPSLTSDVLKLSNSAGFITSKRIEQVNEAVMTIGLKNLNAILTASSARRILDQRFSKFEQIWNHCNKTAYYARFLAMKFRLPKITEGVFLTGLLHDLGKIVLLSTNLELTNWIADVVNNRKIRTSTIMEEVSIGISHSSIGDLIAGHWSFPEYLADSIKCHHAPLNAKNEFRDYVYITYLANMFCGVESRKYDYHYLEGDVLDRYGIADVEEARKLHEEIKGRYETDSLL
ncbi:MAG TPA: HDOD domain-containing protein [Spirochaetota bacterium]|nr:HDOD domain-containing protein [Spirochaetota bacterium]